MHAMDNAIQSEPNTTMNTDADLIHFFNNRYTDPQLNTFTNCILYKFCNVNSLYIDYVLLNIQLYVMDILVVDPLSTGII